jgi:hypothetical protein
MEMTKAPEFWFSNFLFESVRRQTTQQKHYRARPEDARNSREMSNMIALVSLDFGEGRSMCGIGKGVEADGRAFG